MAQNRFSVGDSVASDMSTIMGSTEHKSIFAGPQPQLKKVAFAEGEEMMGEPEGVDISGGASVDVGGESVVLSGPPEAVAKVKDCWEAHGSGGGSEMELGMANDMSQAFDKSVEVLASISGMLDRHGFGKTAEDVLIALNNLVAEASEKEEDEDEEKDEEKKEKKEDEDEDDAKGKGFPFFQKGKKDKEEKEDDKDEEKEDKDEEKEDKEDKEDKEEKEDEGDIFGLPEETDERTGAIDEILNKLSPEQKAELIDKLKAAMSEGNPEGTLGEPSLDPMAEMMSGMEENPSGGSQTAGGTPIGGHKKEPEISYTPEFEDASDGIVATFASMLSQEKHQRQQGFVRVAKANKDKGGSNKTDPKAKVRNRGNVCVPASKAKDNKDHFPINSESQARNALARVNQFDKAPSWWGGSLQSLVSHVAKCVKKEYKGIEVSKKSTKPKKGSLDTVLVALGSDRGY